MTATLPALAVLGTPDVLAPRSLAMVRVWDAMLRGARAYVERNGFLAVAPTLLDTDAQSGLARLVPELGSVYTETPTGRIELEQPGGLDEVVVHVTGVVQAAAREVIARCSDELALFGRDRDELRNITFEHVSRREPFELTGPCFVAGDCERASVDLLMPGAGHAAHAVEHDTVTDDDIEGPLHSGAVIELARVARFLIDEEQLE